jgi:hypothetical protein
MKLIRKQGRLRNRKALKLHADPPDPLYMRRD